MDLSQCVLTYIFFRASLHCALKKQRKSLKLFCIGSCPWSNKGSVYIYFCKYRVPQTFTLPFYTCFIDIISKLSVFYSYWPVIESTCAEFTIVFPHLKIPILLHSLWLISFYETSIFICCKGPLWKKKTLLKISNSSWTIRAVL